MKETTTFNLFRFYNFMLLLCLSAFTILFINYLVNSFYTRTQSRVNDPKVSSIAWDLSDVKLRQNRVYTGKAYQYENQLLLKDVRLGINSGSMSNLPVNLLKRDRKTVKAVYYELSNLMLLPVEESQFKNLKIWLGLIRCMYILMIIFVIWQVRSMLISVKNDQYFQSQNANKMRLISLILFLVPSFKLTFNFFLERYFRSVFDIPDLRFARDYDAYVWLWIVAGILAVTLAYIISNGVKIKQENDLTI